jgi:hypothetical protein
MFLRASFISSAISDADSLPMKEKMMTDQNSMSSMCAEGVSVFSVKEFAEPNLCQARTPRTTTIRTGIHMARAPML